MLLVLLYASVCHGFVGPRHTTTRGGQPLYFFDKLTESMASISDSFSGKKRLNEANIASALKNVKRALIDADVNVRVANGLVENVRESALGVEQIKGVSPSEQFVKAMYDELVRIMGGDDYDQAKQTSFEGRVVLLCGLQGAGKTTAAAKLARYLKEEQGKKPLLVACDVYRPAAAEQLRLLGEKIDVPVFTVPNSTDPVAIATSALASADEYDVVVVDTAGRQVVEDSLMAELRGIKKVCKPDETLLVLDAMTGQDAARLCVAFDEATPLSGAVLTKLDGDARGGAALSVRAVSGVPIKFVGTGERVEDLEPFYPERMASRVLGMGDVVSLVEKAQKTVSEEEAKEQMARLTQGDFNFEDYLSQCETVASMGSFANVAKMMPGMSSVGEAQISAADRRAKTAKSLILSMTKKERQYPDLLIRDKSSMSRLRRIGRGAGYELTQAQTFLSEFQTMRNMMSKMANSAPQQQEGAVAAAPGGGGGGNRAARRAAGKKAKRTRNKPRGF